MPIEIEKKKLENNLETLFINSPGSSSASVQIWFRAGSALETKDNEGIAHFLEHMFFKGTPTRPGSQIAHQVESYGGEINAFTSFDYTCYYINTPSNHLNQTVDILMDMVSNPEFKQEELVPERDVVFEEYRRSLDNPNQFNFMELQKSCFQDGYGHPILGREETIKNFSREQLNHFRESFYNTNNSMLVVSGDISNKEEIEKTIKKYHMPSGKTSRFPEFKLKSKASINIHQKEVRQTTLTITIKAPHYESPLAGAEDLAINCLAYGETSRLYQGLVVNSSLASGLSGSTMYFVDGGAHYLKLAFPSENIQQVLKEMSSILAQIFKEGFSEEEVTKIKNQYVASKIYEKESIESYAFSLGHGFAQNGDIHCEDGFIDRLKKTTPTQVNDSLREIFSRNLHLTIQTPKKESAQKTKKAALSLQEAIKKALPQKKKLNEKLKIKKSKFDPEASVIELKKGVQLIYRQNLMTPTFVFHTYVKGGLSHENEQICGAHYLLGKCLTYGYKGLKYLDLKNDLENKSAYLNGFSGKNAYGLTLHGLTENFEDLIEHSMLSFLQPQVPTKYLSLEKQLVKRALENQKEDPVKQCFKAFNKIIFNKHPYSLDLIGTESSLKKNTAKSLLELHQKNIKKHEIVFTYCGDLSLDYILNTLKPYLKRIPARNGTKALKNKINPLSNQKMNLEFDREQTQIFIGRSAFGIKKKEDIYLKMLTSHLSGQSSELFVEVRDRQGLCYAVQPVHHTALEAGYWGIYIAAGHDKTQAAIKAILTVLEQIKNGGISKEQFERIKTMIEGQNLINIQTNDDFANIYSIPVLHDLGLDLEHVSNEKIKHIQYDEFQAFIRKFLDTKWNIVQAGRN